MSSAFRTVGYSTKRRMTKSHASMKNQRHGTCSKTICVSRTCKLTVFVVNVANFWYIVIEIGYRILNCIMHLRSFIFWLLSFAWDPSTSFQSHFCCSYCFVYSFLFGIYLCRLLSCSVFVRRNGTTDFAKTGQVSDDTINLINC